MVGFSTNFTGALDAYQSVFGGQAKSDKLPQTASEQAGEAVDKPKKVSLSSPGDLLSRIVGNKLANAGFEKPQETESATGFFDIDQVVDTVAGYVEGFIERERSAGASEERIQELANAARQGVEQGFGEAREIITDAGIMTDELAEDIDTSETQIYDRIDQIVAPKDDSGDELPAETEAPRNDLFRPENLVSASGFDYRQQSGVVEIETNDGDTISISLASLDYSSFDYQKTGDGSSFGYSAYSGSQFSVSVDGELDEGELNALNDFLGQVDSLAQSFFSGDLDTALEQAMSLGYDSSELASFTLDFSYSEVQATTRTYQNVQDLGEGQGQGLASLPNLVDPLKQFAEEVQSTVDKASLFQSSAAGMLDLLEQFIADKAEASDLSPSERIQEFARSLFEEVLPEAFGTSSEPEPEDGISVDELAGEVDA